MTLKFNPLANKGFDYFLHQGIASYKFTGWTEGELVSPGVGNIYFNFDPFGFGYAVMSIIDSHGYDMSYNLMMMFFATDYYDLFITYHGKTNSDQFMTLMVIPEEEWIEVTEGEGEEETLVGYAVPIWPVFFSMNYDAEEDEYIVDEFPENGEVLMSFDLAFNPDYLGTMADQDSDMVSISGGTISGTNNYGYEDGIWILPYKTTTGDPEYGQEGQIYVNQFDKLVRIYLDDAWRTLLDFS